MGKMDKLCLGYWGIRVRGNPIRMALGYGGVQFNDLRFASPNAWHKVVKPQATKMGCPFLNLPFLVDINGTVITQSKAVLLYVCGKCDMGPRSLRAQGYDRMLLDELVDMHEKITSNSMVKDADTPQFRKKFLNEQLKARLSKMDQWLTTQKTMFLTGSSLAASDFYFYE